MREDKHYWESKYHSETLRTHDLRAELRELNKRIVPLAETAAKYELLLKTWQSLLVKEVERDREIINQDKLILSLQERIKDLLPDRKCGKVQR